MKKKKISDDLEEQAKISKKDSVGLFSGKYKTQEFADKKDKLEKEEKKKKQKKYSDDDVID